MCAGLVSDSGGYVAYPDLGTSKQKVNLPQVQLELPWPRTSLFPPARHTVGPATEPSQWVQMAPEARPIARQPTGRTVTISNISAVFHHGVKFDADKVYVLLTIIVHDESCNLGLLTALANAHELDGSSALLCEGHVRSCRPSMWSVQPT